MATWSSCARTAAARVLCRSGSASAAAPSPQPVEFGPAVTSSKRNTLPVEPYGYSPRFVGFLHCEPAGLTGTNGPAGRWWMPRMGVEDPSAFPATAAAALRNISALSPQALAGIQERLAHRI